MELLTPEEFGKKLDPPVSGRRVLELCRKGQIKEALKVGRAWAIPANAKDPRDPRYMRKDKKG